MALADRAAGLIDEEGRRPDPDDYRQHFLTWLYHDPEQTEEAQIARLKRELEVA